MITLKNETTGKTLKLSDADARDIFGIEGQNQAHLVCLPARSIVPKANNVQIVHERKRAKKIGGTCIIRMGGLGDLIMLSSSIVKYKAKLPDRPVTLATLPRYVQIMNRLKGVDHCIAIDDIASYSFDDTIDLRYAVEPPNIGPGSLSWRQYVSCDRSDNFDALCKVNSSRKYFNVPVDSDITKSIKKDMPDGLKIAFCPTTASIYRAVPPEYVAPVAKKLSSLANVILIGKTEAWNEELTTISGSNFINLLNQTNDAELIALCSLMDVIISPDTGVLHIAGALKKKAIGVFGNINPRTRVSYYPTVRALYPKGKLPCIPCHDVPGACDSDRPGAPCMRLITPNKIVRAAKELL